MDVDESVKPGDELKLQYADRVPEQDNRIVYELIAADTVETTTYGGVGISTDSNFNKYLQCGENKQMIWLLMV